MPVIGAKRRVECSEVIATDQAGENIFDYLNALQRHQQLIKENPSQWLPWNYRETLENLNQEKARSNTSAINEYQISKVTAEAVCA